MAGYIETDPVVTAAAENAIQDMGETEALAALLLDGPPGCGKTYLAKRIAVRLNAKLISFQAFPGCGKWEMLMDDPDPATGVRNKGLLLQSAELSQTEKVVMLINEIDKAAASVDSFLLDFLNDGRLFIPQLGEFVVKGSNYICVLTKNDQRNITDALMRRCRCGIMGWPTTDVEVAIMQAAIPQIEEKACKYLIQIAQRLRNDARVIKKPSPPEVVRLARDIIRMLQGEGLRERPLGKYISMGLLPHPADRTKDLFEANELSTGLGAQENFAESVKLVQL
jgi:MoxR-like ATPase